MGNDDYTLIEARGIDSLPAWAPHIKGYDEVVGFTCLGHAVLRSSDTANFAVLHPFEKALKGYGPFDSMESFRRAVLEDEGFREYAMPSRQLDEIRQHCGALSEGQVYIPQPHPMLGGAMRPESYTKGDVWVFLEIAGQNWGL